MMSEMGKKKNVKIFSAAVALIFVLSIAAIAVMQMGNPVNAAPSSNIGIVDMSKVFAPDNADLQNAQKEMQQASQDMQKKFEEQSASMNDEQKGQLYQTMQGEMAKKQEEIQKGLKDKVDNAVNSVASTKGLSLVVDKRVVLYGGTDITDQVAKKLSESK
ncbi:OmpH family outer membrane protein [Megasphaera paucivorans]|uniref:Periplasmic chaperone for outer membrane proteins Skp n=1 Tax=Megasphaera paucivorans TaxID=349095 RepID=A0A1G9TEP5_9FIRM|nr:OmpH family outer membrane protein [Megasphaera paucivorans]SDM46157.1 periplasmic chaperone for outer membrane proteins Skp [Megasphaera paucivorans]